MSTASRFRNAENQAEKASSVFMNPIGSRIVLSSAIAGTTTRKFAEFSAFGGRTPAMFFLESRWGVHHEDVSTSSVVSVRRKLRAMAKSHIDAAAKATTTRNKIATVPLSLAIGIMSR